MIYFLLFLLILGLFFSYQFGLFIPRNQQVRVLMYHKVSENGSDFLTVTSKQLEEQIQYVVSKGYQFIGVNDWINAINGGKSLPKKPLLLSFDDGYLNNLTLGYPILKKYQARATVFYPSAYVVNQPVLSILDLKSLDSEVFELALHSHKHQNYKDLSTAEMEQDLDANIAFFKQNGLSYAQGFAYPYGGRPKDKHQFEEMKTLLKQKGIEMAFRIGNKLNYSNPKEVYAVNRIDIRGTNGFFIFKWKLRFGRLKF
jgi:peptidoglycan/xylan/chitin deacetylase (PgdA/CDA1 family)